MNALAGAVVDFYRRHADRWAQARGTHPAEGDWLDRFVALLEPRAAILDIGCGSGRPIADALTRQGFAVTGVDSSPEMIGLYRANLPGASAHVADMRGLALGERFDGVIVWDSLFHLAHDDQRRMFATIARHARHGAPVMFTSGPTQGEAIDDLFGEPLYHASLAPNAYRRLLGAAGCDLVAHVVEDPACDRTVWLAQRRSW